MENIKSDYDKWLEERKTYIGGSEAGKVLGVSRWGCQRSVYNDKTGVEKDFQNDDKPEFRRGRRLEPVAAAYYVEKTGRQIKETALVRDADRPHLAINMDRLVFSQDRETPGYLELKVLGRYSFQKMKKEGIPDDYISQLQWGMAVSGLKWGSYGIYCPDSDDFEWLDREADPELGRALMERGDDLWNFHVEPRIAPDPLPYGSQQCEGCVYSLSCHSAPSVPVSKEVIQRPDLEALAGKLAEVKGMSSEASDAEEAIKADIMAAIKEQPGKYQAGRYEFQFTVSEQKRFSGEDLKRAHPEMYEKFRKTSVTKTLRKPKEI